MAEQLTPEQRAAVVAGAEFGVVLFFALGAGIGALAGGKGSRGKGALIGGGIAVLAPLVVHVLAVESVSEVVKP